MFSARREGEKGGRVADGQGREMIAWLRGWTRCARFCPSLVSAEVEGKVKRGFENENKIPTEKRIREQKCIVSFSTGMEFRLRRLPEILFRANEASL